MHKTSGHFFSKYSGSYVLGAEFESALLEETFFLNIDANNFAETERIYSEIQL